MRGVQTREQADDDRDAIGTGIFRSALRAARSKPASVSPRTYSMTRKSSLSRRHDVENRDDVRVLDARREPRLVEEHRRELRIAREVRMKPLDRDGLAEPARARLPREINGGHSAGRELGVERVAPELKGLTHAETISLD